VPPDLPPHVPPQITATVQCAAAILLQASILLDLASALWIDRRAKSTATGFPPPAVRALSLEQLASTAVACLVVVVLVLITPAKYDSDKKLCLVYTNLPEHWQSYDGA
jgi:hypothetical protein